MSFVDLATLTLHRRNELESRIQVFDGKCDHAIEAIKKLKNKAHSFVSQLNCEPAELKERFLQFTKKLDEYQYLVTDFNLAVSQLEDSFCTDITPVQDNKVLPQPLTPYSLIDALSETAPSTNCACSNLCPPDKPKRTKISKDEQTLIAFSSSTSAESVPDRKVDVKADDGAIAEEVENLTLEEHQKTEIQEQTFDETIDNDCALPPQVPLELDKPYSGVIMHVDGSHFYIITEDTNEVREFMLEMNDYYFNNRKTVTPEEVQNMAYCAFYDPLSNSYYRALCLKDTTSEGNKKILYGVDLGELQTVPIDAIRPLIPQFCQRPPYVRPCYLAGVDLTKHVDSELMKKQETFLKKYIGVVCTIHVDDDTSEALGVYVTLPSGEILNEKFIQAGLADPIDNNVPVAAAVESKSMYGPPEAVDSELDITDLPEHEDPVEAVTGYHNRDEIDICKFYKGGPEKTCFKGSRCNKKHIMKHPDGWTLDRVEVPAKVKAIRLPAPDTFLTVRVTYVCHFDRVYVQIVDENEKNEPVPEFGIVLPPTTLKNLIQDMNSPATITAYKKLQLAPAPGELVAAIYPLDQCWYRARVLTVTRADQSVEVMYIDYGTVLWIKADQIRALESRFLSLPAQAVRCVLAGVTVRSHNADRWAAAKAALAALVQDATLTAHVISREYDEITVDLIDEEGYSISEQLATTGLFDLQEYSVIKTVQSQVVP